MFRQAGRLSIDEDGIAEKGVIVRHLILPHDISGTGECLRWLSREVSPEITLSLMSQYHPSHRAGDYPELSRHYLGRGTRRRHAGAGGIRHRKRLGAGTGSTGESTCRISREREIRSKNNQEQDTNTNKFQITNINNQTS